MAKLKCTLEYYNGECYFRKKLSSRTLMSAQFRKEIMEIKKEFCIYDGRSRQKDYPEIPGQKSYIEIFSEAAGLIFVCFATEYGYVSEELLLSTGWKKK